MDALAFLEALYGGAEAGYLCLWPPTSTWPVSALAEVAAAAERRGARGNLYFGVGLLGQRPAPDSRGSEADVSVIPGAWIDIDVGTDGHKGKGGRPATVDEALEEVRRLPLQPSVVVNTGGGVHCYWLFDEPWTLDDAREQADARRLVAGWQEYVRARWAARGWTVDSTHDLSRILRLPGTLNHKYQPPRPVRVIEHTPFRYDQGDFEDYILGPIFNQEIAPSASPAAAQPQVPVRQEITPVEVPLGERGGRNNACKAIVAACLERGESLERTVFEVLSYDYQNHNPPLFGDRSEVTNKCLDPEANALAFTARIAESLNRSRERQGLPPQRFSLAPLQVERAEAAEGFDLMAWTADRYKGKAPPQRWLVRDVVPLPGVTILAADGGVGKGWTLVRLLLDVAGYTDGAHAFGNPIIERGRAVGIFAEDGPDEIHRRLEALDPQNSREHLGDRLIVVGSRSGKGLGPVLERVGGGYRVTEAWTELHRGIVAAKPKLVVIDPLSSIAGVDTDKDSAAASRLLQACCELADEAECAVIVAHHMTKGSSANPIQNAADARRAVRGAGALVNGTRSTYAFWPMDDGKARDLCERLGEPFERDRVYAGAVVKSNAPGDRREHVWIRSRQTGLLLDRTKDVQGMAPDYAGLLVEAITRAHAEGQPFTLTGTNSLFARRVELPDAFAKAKKDRLEALVRELLDKRQVRKKGRGYLVPWYGGVADQGSED